MLTYAWNAFVKGLALPQALRVLVVEDEYLIAAGIEEMLSDIGHEDVNLAHDLACARFLLQLVKPDFALLDVNIGSELVFPFAAELASQKVPFVFSTGVSPDRLPASWRGVPVLAKPLQREELRARMRRMGLPCGA